jgi:hypothetical protein
MSLRGKGLHMAAFIQVRKPSEGLLFREKDLRGVHQIHTWLT